MTPHIGRKKYCRKHFCFCFFVRVCLYVCKTSLKEVSPDSDSEAIMSCNYICHLLGYRVTRKHKHVYTFASKQMKNEGDSWRTVGLNRLKLLLESSRANNTPYTTISLPIKLLHLSQPFKYTLPTNNGIAKISNNNKNAK